jgi:hypothetical protein
VTTFIDDQRISKVFCYKVCVLGFTFFEIVLNQHWRRRRGGSHKISWIPRIIWRYHLERASFPHLPYRYSTNKLGNMTTIILLIRLHFYDLHDPAFSASDSERAFFTIDFSFQHIFIWRLGFGGFGVRENRGHLVSRITTVRRARVRRYHMAALHNFRLPFICLYYPKKCFTFVWRIHVPATFITHRLGVLHAESPQGSAFLLLVITYSSR